MNCKSCEFSITDVVDPDEGIEVMLYCSFYDCLAEDIPEVCTAAEEMELLSELRDYNDALIHGPDETLTEALTEDDIPF